MNLFKEWNEYLASVLGLKPKDKEYKMAHFLFWEYMNRKVTVRPRNIISPSDFICPKEFESGFLKFQNYVETGKDLTPFMSKGVNRAKNIDPLHTQWGVRHFHLGSKLKGEFVSRTGPLLFAVVRKETVYVLGVWKHGDWVNKQILNVITDNWPSLLDRNRVESMTITNLDDSPEYLEKTRELMTSNALELSDGNQYLFGDMTISGHSYFTVTAYTHFISYWERLEAQISSYLLNNLPLQIVEPRLEIKNNYARVICYKSGFTYDVSQQLYCELTRISAMITNLET